MCNSRPFPGRLIRFQPIEYQYVSIQTYLALDVPSHCSSDTSIHLIEGARAERSREREMPKIRTAEVEQEPVGIVISQGSRAEQTPRLVAYVWGPAPTDSEPAGEMVAA